MAFDPDPMSLEVISNSGELTGQTDHGNQGISSPPWQVKTVIWKAGRRKFDSGYWSVPLATQNGSKRTGTFVLSSQAQQQIDVLNNGGILHLRVVFEDGTPEWLKVKLA